MCKKNNRIQLELTYWNFDYILNFSTIESECRGFVSLEKNPGQVISYKKNRKEIHKYHGTFSQNPIKAEMLK